MSDNDTDKKTLDVFVAFSRTKINRFGENLKHDIMTSYDNKRERNGSDLFRSNVV